MKSNEVNALMPGWAPLEVERIKLKLLVRDICMEKERTLVYSIYDIGQNDSGRTCVRNIVKLINLESLCEMIDNGVGYIRLVDG